MCFTFTVSFYSQPQEHLQRQRLQTLTLTSGGGLGNSAQFVRLPTIYSARECRRRCMRYRSLVVRAAPSIEGASSRTKRGFHQSQAERPLSSAPVKQIAPFVVPTSISIAVTFGLSNPTMARSALSSQHFRFVVELELSYNPIGPGGAKDFAEVLKVHGNVKILKLGANGTEVIADALKYNTTISVLDLQGNGLRDEDDGAFAIAQALKSNDDIAVISLNMSSNFLTKFRQSALSDARDDVYEMTEKEINIFL